MKKISVAALMIIIISCILFTSCRNNGEDVQTVTRDESVTETGSETEEPEIRVTDIKLKGEFADAETNITHHFYSDSKYDYYTVPGQHIIYDYDFILSDGSVRGFYDSYKYFDASMLDEFSVPYVKYGKDVPFPERTFEGSLPVYEEDGIKVELVCYELYRTKNGCVFRVTDENGQRALVSLKWCGELSRYVGDGNELRIYNWEPSVEICDMTGDGIDDVVLTVPSGHGTEAYQENISVIDGETFAVYEVEDLNGIIENNLVIDFDTEGYTFGVTEPVYISIKDIINYNYSYYFTSSESESEDPWDTLGDGEKEQTVSRFLRSPTVGLFRDYRIEDGILKADTIIKCTNSIEGNVLLTVEYQFDGSGFIYGSSKLTDYQ